MAQKLTVDIELAGAEDVEKAFGEIGKAAEKAFEVIEKAADDVGGFQNLKFDDVVDKLKAVGVEGEKAFDALKRATEDAARMETILQSLDTLNRQLAELGEAGRAAFSVIDQAAAEVGGFDKLNPEEVTNKLRELGVEGREAFDKIKQAVETVDLIDKIRSESQQVEQQFDQLVSASEQAFERISQSAQRVNLEELKTDQASQQLTNLGDAGAAAFDKITASAQRVGEVQLGRTSEQLNTTTEAADKSRGTFEALSETVEATALAKIAFGNAAGGLTTALGTLGRAFGGVGVAVAAIVTPLEAAASAIRGVNEQAMKLGLTIEAFDQLRIGMGEAGIASDKLAGGLGKLQSAMDDAAIKQVTTAIKEVTEGGPRAAQALQILLEALNGSGKAAEKAREAFEKFGFEIPDALAKATKAIDDLIKSGEPLDEVFADVIDVLAKMPDGVERTRLAMSKLGTELGIKVVGALRTGAIKSGHFSEAQEKTLRITSQAAENATRLEQANNRLSAALSRLNGVAFAPLWIKVLEGATWFVDELGQAIHRVSSDLASFDLGAWAKEVDAALSRAPGAAWQWIVDTFNAAVDAVGQKREETNQAITTWFSQAPGAAWQWIVDTFNAAVESLRSSAQSAWQSVVTAVSQAPGEAWQWIVDTFNSAGQSVYASAQSLWQSVVDTIAAAPGNVWAWLLDSFNSVVDSIVNAAAEVGGKIAGALGFSGGGVAADGMAHGGIVGGRGTGTSDSNLAWLSRGEHVMPARAVRQPGVLAFLEALRRSGGNLTRVLDGMGRFALGGLVRAPIPAFAQGGLNGGGMSNVTIQFPGLPEVTGLRASSAAVDELRKAAALAQIRSGGRKPSRYS